MSGSMGTFDKFADNANVKVVSIDPKCAISFFSEQILSSNEFQNIQPKSQEELTIIIQMMIKITLWLTPCSRFLILSKNCLKLFANSCDGSHGEQFPESGV